jgi:hypothetical protein
MKSRILWVLGILTLLITCTLSENIEDINSVHAQSEINSTNVELPYEVPDQNIRADKNLNDIDIMNLVIPNDIFLASMPARNFSSSSRSNTPKPGIEDQSDFMIGTVAVTVIFPESDGSYDSQSENWSQTRMQECIDEINTGLSWWEGQIPSGHLKFKVITYGNAAGKYETQTTKYEPIRRISDDQQYWMDEILSNLGFTGTTHLDKGKMLNNYVREKEKTDWAYTIWVVDSLNDPDGYFKEGDMAAYALFGGPFVVMTYKNGNYGIAQMNRVIAHETGHIFYALDEYVGSLSDGSSMSGYLNIINGNYNKSTCVMEIVALLSACTYTKQQIGWRDSDGDGILDPIDTFPKTELLSHYTTPSNKNILTYNGSSVEVPLKNNNPNHPGHELNDVSINTIQNVQYRIDGGLWQDAPSTDGKFDNATEQFTFTTPKIADGNHKIEVRSQNSVGNWETTYSADTVTIDTTPPADFSPIMNASGWVKISQPIITFNTSDATSGLAYYEVRIDNGSYSKQTSPFTLPTQPDGEHTVIVRAIDKVGNTKESTPIILKIDSTPPADFTPTISGLDISFATSDTTSGIDHYEVSVDGSNFTVHTSPYTLQKGTKHTVTVRAFDKAGNYREKSLEGGKTADDGSSALLCGILIIIVIIVIIVVAVIFIRYRRRRQKPQQLQNGPVQQQSIQQPPIIQEPPPQQMPQSVPQSPAPITNPNQNITQQPPLPQISQNPPQPK